MAEIGGFHRRQTVRCRPQILWIRGPSCSKSGTPHPQKTRAFVYIGTDPRMIFRTTKLYIFKCVWGFSTASLWPKWCRCGAPEDLGEKSVCLSHTPRTGATSQHLWGRPRRQAFGGGGAAAGGPECRFGGRGVPYPPNQPINRSTALLMCTGLVAMSASRRRSRARA